MCDIPLRTMQNNTLSRAADGFPDGGIGPRRRPDERHRAGHFYRTNSMNHQSDQRRHYECRCINVHESLTAMRLGTIDCIL